MLCLRLGLLEFEVFHTRLIFRPCNFENFLFRHRFLPSSSEKINTKLFISCNLKCHHINQLYFINNIRQSWLICHIQEQLNIRANLHSLDFLVRVEQQAKRLKSCERRSEIRLDGQWARWSIGLMVDWLDGRYERFWEAEGFLWQTDGHLRF